ncbi:MAG TPA: APC family permease [Gaiellales bacterium]|nr:APC family permease [Gaiellales bacterium]
MAEATESATTPRTRGLRGGSLSIWEAVGISIALMAPSMAANINPQGTVGLVGRAVPLAFVFATVGVLLVSYTFVRLCQVYNHAGSVFGFVGATLGPRAGVLAGWSLIGTYTFYACVTCAAAGIFTATFLDEIGVWNNPPLWSQFLFAFIALAGAFALATFPAHTATRILLSIEGITVLLIITVATVVLIKVITGDTPGNQTFTLKVFSPPSGTNLGDIFKGAVFGFLSFAGFEAAATLGEETREPRRAIPRAILATAVFGGIYFIYVTSVEMMGFGTDAKGVAAFGSSGSLLGDLGKTYITSSIGNVITLGTAISAFGCCLACVVGGSRIVYTLSRDGLGTTAFGNVRSETGSPVRALALVTLVAAVIVAACRIFFTHDVFDVFVWSGVIGTLILLVAYVLATLGAVRLLWFRGTHRVPIWQIIVPVAALVVLVATLYYNVDPDAVKATRWNYYTAGIWVAAGAVLVLVLPGLAKRVGRGLAQHEGLADSSAGE